MNSKPTNTAQFSVYSDGSGHVDGYGGWACYVDDHTSGKAYFRQGSVIGTSVDRMEMTAMLEGMEIVMELARRTEQYQTAKMLGEVWKPLVHLFSDRENMVLSIKGVYERSNGRDLWARFAYYEDRCAIVAHHVNRETETPQFRTVDLYASTGRVVAKNCRWPVPTHLTQT
jgi:ribonuclease HI